MRQALPLLAVLLAACSGATPSPTAQPTATPAPTETAPPATPGDLPHSLTLWLPPRFAPDPVTAAGSLLLDRLQAFESEYDRVQLSVRVKADKAIGDSLLAASQAASGTLPDLAILDAADLAQAGELLVPADQLELPETARENYRFAQPEAAPANGVAFAGDLELFAFRTAVYDSPPTTWSALFTDQGTFLVPASDPESRFLIAQYLALGGPVDQIDTDLLAVALGFLGSANDAGALAPSSLDFASSAETWATFLAGRSEAAAAPFSAFVAGYSPLDYAAGPLPTSDGSGISLAKSWSMSLIDGDPMADALLQWLLDPGFLAQWTYAMGLVPAQPAVLDRWPDTPETAIASRLVAVAEPLPDPQVLASLGPSFAAALRAVLVGELAPQEAAAMAGAGGR